MEVRTLGALVADGEAEFIVWAYETPKSADGIPQEELVQSVGVANIGTHGTVRFGKAGKGLAILPRLFSVAGVDREPTAPTPIEVDAATSTSPASDTNLGLLTAGKALSEYTQPQRAWTYRLSDVK